MLKSAPFVNRVLKVNFGHPIYRPMTNKTVLLLLFLTVASFAASAQKADVILGSWANASGEDHILIYKKGNKYFGKLDWIKFPNDDQGKAKSDKHNPNEALRTRPLLGLELLKDFVYDEDNVYDDGTIYDPKSGKTYSCKMTLEGNTLKIRGYVGISLFGRSETWTRTK
jgi:uncharacterized protein (DUF2147 family)